MSKLRVIYEEGNYRITEHLDGCFDLENLKGDMFSHQCMKEMHGSEMTLSKLKQLERDFEEEVEREGVFGYVLERWNPEINVGWEHVDSCWGFVGQYSEHEERYRHYIVDELKAQINE